jgi:hypothetical protein
MTDSSVSRWIPAAISSLEKSPRNLYLHYNEIVFNKHFIKLTAVNMINYFYFLFFFVVLILGMNGELRRLRRIWIVKKLKNSDGIFISLICFGSCFPYIMANKSPKPLDFFDWSWRHAIVLLVPFTLLSLKLQTTKQTHIYPRNLDVQRVIKGVSISLIVCLTSLSNYAHVQSMVYDKRVIQLLSDNRDSWTKSEIVCLESSVKRMNNARFYELNEMAWEATGQINWQFYPDTMCSSHNIPSGSLRNSPQLSGMTDIQWKNVYMGGIKNSKWMAVRITGQLGFLDVIYGAFGGDNNPLKMEFGKLESGSFKGSDE